jgi:putative flippase GtrA
MNAVAREARTSRSGPLGQLVTYAAIGLVSTAAYALLFWRLRPLAPAAVANAVALLVTAVANTAANRRLTFGVQGRDGLAGDHAGGLLALAFALATTNLAMAALPLVRPNPSPAVELAGLTVANAAATVLRFALLRALILGRRHRLRAAAGQIR